MTVVGERFLEVRSVIVKRIKILLKRKEGNMEDYFVDEEENERFSQLVDEVEIKTRKITRIPKNTRNVNNWAVNAWREWAEWRNRKDPLGKQVPMIDEDVVSDIDLGYWLARFVLEVRKKDKKEYPAETLWSMWLWKI